MKRKAFTLVKSNKVGSAKGGYLTGFTLVELLVVVAIIGILATIVMINLTGAQAKSRYAKVIADMVSIGKAVDQYQIDHFNVYPGDGTCNDEATGTNPKMSGTGGLLFDSLPNWPTTPCGDDYAYEYQNWNTNGSSNFAGTGYAGVHFVHDATHTTPSDRWVYYYDIHDFSLVTAAKGVDIKNVSRITCKE